MLLETESGIMARADAHVTRLLMGGSRTARRLLAADRTITRAYQRVLMLRQFRASCEAREHARIEREIARELTPSWGKTMRFRVGAAVANTASGAASRSRRGRIGQATAKATSSRRAIRVYQCPLLDSRGRVAIFFRVRYAGLKSKNWRSGLSADHALYILREEALEDGEIVGRLGPISNMGTTPEEIAACWRALELAEEGYRANATVQHRIIWNLPHGLTSEQRHAMVEGYCKRTFGRLGLPYVAAIHKADDKGDQRNYHAHICFSGRPCERVGEGRFEIALEKVNGLTDDAGLKRLRALACAHANDACRDAGLAVRFSHLTYKERAIDAVRQKHVGAAAMAAHDRGEKVAIIEHNERVVERNETAYARDAAARELILVARLTALTKTAANHAVARQRLAAIKAQAASIAERAKAMATNTRPVARVTWAGIADLASRARVMAETLATQDWRRSAMPSVRRVTDVAVTARRLADERRLDVERRAGLASARSRLAATRARVAGHRKAQEARRRAEALILDGVVVPYSVREGRLVLDTAGMTPAEVGLVMTLDDAALAVALRERHRRDRERDAAEALAREQALARQREEDERRRRRVEDVCRLLLDTPNRPYRQDGNVYRFDPSRLDEPGRALIEATGTGDKAIAEVLRQRVERDRQADAFDAMVTAVEKERLVVASDDEHYAVDKATMARFGVTPATIDAAGAQDRLKVVNERQRAEVVPLLLHVMGNADQIVHNEHGWTLSAAAPAAMRRVAEAWRHHPGVRRGFEQTLATHRRLAARADVEVPAPAGPTPEPSPADAKPQDRWRAARERRNQAMAAWDEAERLDGVGLPRPGRQLHRPGTTRTQEAGQAAAVARWIQGRQGPGW